MTWRPLRPTTSPTAATSTDETELQKTSTKGTGDRTSSVPRSFYPVQEPSTTPASTVQANISSNRQHTSPLYPRKTPETEHAPSRTGSSEGFHTRSQRPPYSHDHTRSIRTPAAAGSDSPAPKPPHPSLDIQVPLSIPLSGSARTNAHAACLGRLPPHNPTPPETT